MFVSSGLANKGSAVIYNRKSTKAEIDHESQLKLIVYTMERASESMNQRKPDSFRWIWIMDLKHWSSSSGTSLNESKRVVKCVEVRSVIHRIH